MMWKAEDKAQSWGEGSYSRQLLRSVLLWGSRWTPAYCSVFSYIAATLICLLRARGEQGCDAVIASSTACVLMVQSDTNHNKRISNRATSISVCPTWLTCSPISLSLSPPLALNQQHQIRRVNSHIYRFIDFWEKDAAFCSWRSVFNDKLCHSWGRSFRWCSKRTCSRSAELPGGRTTVVSAKIGKELHSVRTLSIQVTNILWFPVDMHSLNCFFTMFQSTFQYTWWRAVVKISLSLTSPSQLS